VDQPALIGKKMYDVYVTEFSVAQNINGTSGLHFTDYAINVISNLLVTCFCSLSRVQKEKDS
jgi:hypothetical protein